VKDVIDREVREEAGSSKISATHNGSITGKTMTRIICFDHITTATTPLPNL